MSVTIITATRDVHARAVEWALQKRGVQTEILMYGDYPQLVRISERIGSKQSSIAIDHINLGGYSGSIGALWRRRLCSPMVRSDLHRSDAAIALKESQCVIDSLEENFDSCAIMSANSIQGHRLAKQKPVQLRLASAIGMPIPETLISNDPDEIRRFYKEHQGQVVIKPFTAPTWKAADRSFFTFTKQVPEFLLTDDAALQAAPAIYQEMIHKSYEVRAFFAGRSYLAAKLHSQDAEVGTHDWRRAGSENLGVEPIVLPEAVTQLCWEYMDALGIVTGSFDFAVTKSGDYVFFEVNEQGQFLWLEQRCPAMPALEMFTDFLISCSPNFTYMGQSKNDISFALYEKSGSWDEVCGIEKEHHFVFEKKPPYVE